jgi:hypothetical protein
MNKLVFSEQQEVKSLQQIIRLCEGHQGEGGVATEDSIISQQTST